MWNTNSYFLVLLNSLSFLLLFRRHLAGFYRLFFYCLWKKSILDIFPSPLPQVLSLTELSFAIRVLEVALLRYSLAVFWL